ncbi:MAG: LPP20 family lipoprotein [Rhodocyclaceae bacterium]
MVATPTKLTAIGYGNPGLYSQYTHGQQKLMAMRAAQVDAYRSLAEQVYGFRVTGNTSVSAFATQNDTIRSQVDAFIRGARVVSVTSIADGNFEAMVELEMTPQFLDCFAYNGNCGMRNVIPACSTPGCATTSVSYVSY